MNYDLDYFITKFEAIPENKWNTGTFTKAHGRRCALGHCGARKHEDDTVESEALIDLIRALSPARYDEIAAINDGTRAELGHTPKQRVVNYLKAVKEFYA